MTTEFYRPLTIQPQWTIEPEAMGSRAKFWYQPPNPNGGEWLFKYPRRGTGEHWAEKIAAETAACLAIPCAKVELAVFQNERGSVTESFAQGGLALWHGNQILGSIVHGYDPEMKFRQSEHTLDNIFHAIDFVFTAPDAAKRNKTRIAEYIVLDALIGNTDRHHENWGILGKRYGDGWKGTAAPTFDHASSLGRELRDARRRQLLKQKQAGRYAERGRGGIYWNEDEKYGPSPLELVRQAKASCPDLLQPALAKLRKLDDNALQNIVARVPTDWMGAPAREFALALMRYNLGELRRL